MNTTKQNSSKPMVMYIIAAAAFFMSVVINFAAGARWTTEGYVWLFVSLLPYVAFLLHGIFYKNDKARIFLSIGLICTIVYSAYRLIMVISDFGFDDFIESAGIIGVYAPDILNVMFLVPVLIDSFVKTPTRKLSEIFLVLRLVFHYAFAFTLYLANGFDEVFEGARAVASFMTSVMNGIYNGYYALPDVNIVYMAMTGLAFLFVMIGHLSYVDDDKTQEETQPEQVPVQPYQQPYQAPYQQPAQPYGAPYQQPYQAPYQQPAQPYGAPYQQPYQPPYQQPAQPYGAPYQQPYQAPYQQPAQPYQAPAQPPQNTDQPQ